MAKLRNVHDDEDKGTEIDLWSHVIEIPFGQIMDSIQRGVKTELLEKMKTYLDTGELWPKVQSAIDIKARAEIVRIGENLVEDGFIDEEEIKSVIRRQVKFKVKEMIEEEVTNTIAASIRKTAKSIVSELNIEGEVRRTIGEKGKAWMSEPGETLKIKV